MSVTIRRCLSALVVVAACVAGFGCESMNEDRDAEKQRTRAERRERRERERDLERDRLGGRDGDSPDRVIGRDRDRRPVDPDRRPVDADRNARGLKEIPTTATRVDEGDATRLTYAPTRDGTLYVYDADGDRVIFSTRVRQDERFALDPDANRATIDGRTVLGTGLSPRNRYRLYFDRGRN